MGEQQKAAEAPLSAVMGPGAHYEGDLSFEGRVRVDGHFRGRIYSEDLLELGAEGVIEGEADVARAIIAGKVIGRIRVREHLLLEKQARVEGLLDVGVCEMRAGAVVVGEVRIRGEESP